MPINVDVLLTRVVKPNTSVILSSGVILTNSDLKDVTVGAVKRAAIKTVSLNNVAVCANRLRDKNRYKAEQHISKTCLAPILSSSHPHIKLLIKIVGSTTVPMYNVIELCVNLY